MFLVKAAGCAAASSLLMLAPPAVPSPGGLSTLSGIRCTSARNCWAVGDYVTVGGAMLNEVLKWNGHRWTKIAVPNPGGTGSSGVNSLLGVACTSSAACWAVGFTSAASHREHTEALHWTGRKWIRVGTPAPRGAPTSSSRLFGVSCTSPSDCWAVGESVNDTVSAPTLNQALHWNGKKWVTARIPDPAGTRTSAFNELTGVWCTSARNCWAVGSTIRGNGLNNAPRLNQALHWNGNKWTAFTTPDPGGTSTSDVSGLASVSCTSQRDCWAVGGYNDPANQAALNEALRWNGKKWAIGNVPDPGPTNYLSAVTCAAGASCWAAGSSGSTGIRGVGIFQNTVLLLSGGTWTRVPSPNPGGVNLGDTNSLTAVNCASVVSCWAVGYVIAGAQPSMNEALRWSGTKWTAG